MLDQIPVAVLARSKRGRGLFFDRDVPRRPHHPEDLALVVEHWKALAVEPADLAVGPHNPELFGKRFLRKDLETLFHPHAVFLVNDLVVPRR